MIRRLSALLLASVLGLATLACSGSDDDSSGSGDPDRSPQEQLADEFLDGMDPEAADLIDGQCIRDLFAVLEDGDAATLLEVVRAEEQLSDDIDPELRELLDSISFRLFDCVEFDLEEDREELEQQIEELENAPELEG